MFEFYEKRKIKRIMYSRPMLVVLCLPLFFLASTVWSAYEKEQNAHENMLASRAELNRLKDRDAALSSEIALLGTERGVEEELRDKYEVGKTGEHMIVLIDKSGDTQENIAQPVEKKGFFETMREKLGF